MLPADHRLRASTDFTEVVRRGRRAGRPTLTLHLLDGGPGTGGPARVGLVVAKAVGGSVVRHRVARQLRHLMRDRVLTVPLGSRLVVRAAPAAATAGSDVLARDLDAALLRLSRPVRP